jgi:hypothetical protein
VPGESNDRPQASVGHQKLLRKENTELEAVIMRTCPPFRVPVRARAHIGGFSCSRLRFRVTTPFMHEGKLTSRCEHGVDEDAGRYRLTFFHENRRLRLITDSTGQIIRRSLIDFGNHR